MFTTWHLIKTDFNAKATWCYGESSRASRLKAVLADGSFAMIIYRCMQASRRHGVAPLEMFFNKLNVVFGQCIIGRGAEFGPGFVLIHAQGVVINGAVRGGEHVYLEHQVTIGAERGQSPQLGHRVFVGAGAKIIGPVVLGDDCKVGANAVVTRDVPSGATVGGIPARVVQSAEEASDAE